MRRILVSGFAAIVSFSVLAINFVSVSAPASVDAVATFESLPQGMARLSDQPVYSPAAPIPGQPTAILERRQPDMAAFTPHTVSPEGSTIDNPVAPPTVSEKPFVAAWPEKPAANIERAKLGPVPTAVGTEILSGDSGRHVAANDRVNIDAVRSIASPEAASFSAPAVPQLIATNSDGPIDFFQPRSLTKIPAIPDVSILAGGNEHLLAQTNVTVFAERTSFNAEAAKFMPPVPAFVTASYQAPESVLFQRARFVAEPDAPISIDILTDDKADHSAMNSVGEQFFERTSAGPEKAWLPAFVSSFTEIASAVFGRERVVETPEGTVSTAILTDDAGEHIAKNEAGSMVNERMSAAPEKASLPAFVSAVTEIAASIFWHERIIETPPAPVSTDILAQVDQHASNSDVVATVERDSNPVKAERAPYIPAFITSLAEAPTAVFQKMGLIPMPEAPASPETVLAATGDHAAASTPAASTNDRGVATPDLAAAPVRKSPVLISTQTAMSSDLLKPMSAGPIVNAPLPNENAVASTGYNATPFDRMIVTPDVPEAVLKAQPTLISAKPEFSMDLLKPMNAAVSNPFVKLDKEEIVAAVQQRDNYCDPNFVGPPIRFSQTVELKLDDLLRQLHQRFGVNFIVGKGVSELPMNIKAGSIPWNVLLKSQLFISGVRARCIDANTIELIENQQLPSLQDGADVETRFVKLKFLQRTTGGSVDLAGRGSGGGQGGQSQGGCSSSGGSGGLTGGGGGGGGQGGGQQGETAASQASSKFDKLVIEIEKILGLRSMTESSSGGQSGGQSQTRTTEAIRTNRFVTQIPGRNILAIRATNEEHDLIDQIIVRADRPPFQVVIKGLVYTANQDKLRDIGVQTTITGGTADGRTTGGVFGDTLGGGGTLFDFSTIIGTFDFNVQATALEQRGVLSVKSRPFSTVIDGLCARLNVGRSIPIIIDSSLGGQGALEFIAALNKLDVTPYVIDDENGNPIAVTLELTMFANDVDNSVVARGVPAISERSIQTQLLLAEDKTAILGGFTVDQDSRTVQKTPGLGDIPIIGELFKRRVNDKRVNRLYFAISVDVIPYPEAIRPVDVPGATTDIPSITPEMKKRADAAEPKQVKGP